MSHVPLAVGVFLLLTGALVTVVGGWWPALGLPMASLGSLLVVTQVSNRLSRR